MNPRNLESRRTGAPEPGRAGAAAPQERGGEGPWLSDEEQWVWRAFLAVHRRLMEALEKQLQYDSAMSMQDYVIMAMLSEATDQRLRMTDLAFISHASPSRTSHAVDRLEARQWVRRERSDEDGRGSLAVLTDLGRSHLEMAAPGHSRTVRENLFDRMNHDELAVLGRIMFSVLDRFHDTGAERAPLGRQSAS